MEDLKVNFVPPEQDPSRKKFFFVLKIVGVIVLGVALLIVLGGSGGPEDGLLRGIREIPVVKRVRQLIRSADRRLEGEGADRINILLLGMGGAGHDGPFLTDTMILASIKPSKNQVALISIPRDMAAPIPNRGWGKVNAANAYAEAENPGEGGEKVRETLTKLFDIPIHYYVRVDFNGFIELIDELGGIDVQVERNFTDTQFPTGENGNVKTITFQSGWQHMDGRTALEFARSRHGTNNESGDFARARRGQKIIEAVRGRVLSLGTLSSPGKVSAVFVGVRDHLRTNFSTRELPALARIAVKLENADILTAVLDDSTDGFLEPTIGVLGAYLLVPKQNNWQPIRQFIKKVFDEIEPAAAAPLPPVRIEVQNGTVIPGLAAEVAEKLRQAGFVVTSIGNAQTTDHEKTVIYDLAGGRFGDAARTLADLLDTEVTRKVPDWVFTDIEPRDPQITETTRAARSASTDFLIIIGADSAN